MPGKTALVGSVRGGGRRSMSRECVAWQVTFAKTGRGGCFGRRVTRESSRLRFSGGRVAPKSRPRPGLRRSMANIMGCVSPGDGQVPAKMGRLRCFGGRRPAETGRARFFGTLLHSETDRGRRGAGRLPRRRMEGGRSWRMRPGGHRAEVVRGCQVCLAGAGAGLLPSGRGANRFEGYRVHSSRCHLPVAKAPRRPRPHCRCVCYEICLFVRFACLDT